MTATIVTAFVPISGHPRAPEEYHALGRKLLALNDCTPMMFAEGDLEHCWLWRYVHGRKEKCTWSTADNAKKNSLAYLCVQAQKSEFLLVASTVDQISDVFVWVDYGIHHIPGVTNQIILDFLRRADDERAVTIPGCWSRDYEYNDQWPCWRFAGGVWIVPRQYVVALDAAMHDEYKRWLKLTNNISWETNCLARIEQQESGPPLWWYYADHNAGMFRNYKRTEQADGKQAQGLRGIESRYC